jgi:glycine cleavage system regulatory protein
MRFPMDASLVMTIIGRDRPGLVDSVAQIVAAHGGNWLESRMSRLGGQFAGILRVAVPASQQPALGAALQKLQSAGLAVVVHPDDAWAEVQNAKGTVLEVVGQDRPGIVRQISHALAEFGVNVEELESECASAAMSGEAIFKARFRISLPPTCKLDELRQRIERIAADLIVDVNFGEAR